MSRSRDRRTRSLGWAAVAACACLAGATEALATGGGRALDRVTRTIVVTPGTPIRVRATVGEISITGWDRPDVVVVDVERDGPGSALERLPVRIDETGGSLEVTVVQLEGGTDARLRGSVRLRVPRDATIEDVQLFEGRLQLESLEGSMRARVERGPIDGRRLSGLVRLETGVGDISLSDATLSPEGVLRCRVFNGDVRLHLARAPADARILVLTLNGAIESAIPLTERAGFGPRFAEATLGRGEPVISIDVVTGDVELTVAGGRRGGAAPR